jgi:hypothetical protein
MLGFNAQKSRSSRSGSFFAPNDPVAKQIDPQGRKQALPEHKKKGQSRAQNSILSHPKARKRAEKQQNSASLFTDQSLCILYILFLLFTLRPPLGPK